MFLLFIRSKDINTQVYGGSQCTNRNYLSFCKLIGSNNVAVLDITFGQKKSSFQKLIKWINYFRGFKEGLSYEIIRKILKQSYGKDYVFIDSSLYGIIAYYLKKNKFKGIIICFFHNVEFIIQLENSKINPFGFWRVLINYYNEKNAIKYSDKIVVLNKRDGNELTRIYGVNNFKIIPISLKDTFIGHLNELTSIPPTFIFIGNNWYANIHGLKWFVENVLEHVNITLQIVGSGMDDLRNDFVHPKIEFFGYVEDLSSLLRNADYAISPIFSGSGMKVKTCESLMYGKNIIGTKEAFEGYEIDPLQAGAICTNKEEFIKTIKNYCSIKREKFNNYSRQCFLEKYSFQSTLIKFEELLK